MEIVDYQVSRDGQSDTLWVYTRVDGTHEILHLINLLGTDNEWRDERGEKKTPTYVKELTVKYYTDKEITQVNMAAFSIEDGISRKISFEKEEDLNGRYIIFNVPVLEYWDMIYMN